MAERKEASALQRLKLLYMRDYLIENTDITIVNKGKGGGENDDIISGVTRTQIEEHLLSEYGIKVERKTFYKDIDLLREYGMDIERDEENNTYYVNHDFGIGELQLLIDSLQSSKFVPLKTAQQISEKLKKLTSHHNRYLLDRRTYVVNRIRTDKEGVFYGVDNIHIAISSNKKINFRYFTYGLDKKEKFYKTDYIVSPYALLWSNENYYLLAFVDNQFKHFRVDKMRDIAEVNEKREGQAEFKASKLDERQTRVFSMFNGVEEIVGLRFTNDLVGVVIDRFGKGINIFACDENHFEIRARVEVSNTFFGWLCGFGKKVKLVSPSSVAQEFANHLKNIAMMYNDVEG